MPETIREILLRSNALDLAISLDIESTLWKWESSVAPFLTITSKLGQGTKAKNTLIQWLQKNPLPVEVIYTGPDGYSGTTPVIANWAYLRVGDRLFNTRGGEVIRVAAKPTTSAVTVTRSWGGTELINLQTGDKLMMLGESQAESLTDTVGRGLLPTNDYNYVELWEDYCRTSNIAADVATVAGEDLRQEQINDLKSFHRKKIELAFLFGERAQTDLASDGYYCRTMRGLYRFIQTNVWPLSDVNEFTRLGFDDFITQINQHTPDKKDRVMVCSGKLIGRVGNWAMGLLQINDQKTKEFGMEVMRYRGLTGGSVDLVEHPLLIGDHLGLLGFVLEYVNMQYRPFKATQLMLGVQEKYQNYWLDKIQTIGTMRIKQEARMGMIKAA